MKQTSVLILLLVMVLLIGGAWLLYENYEPGSRPDVLTPVTPDDTTAPTGDSAPAEDTTAPDAIQAPGFTVQDGGRQCRVPCRYDRQAGDCQSVGQLVPALQGGNAGF